MEQKKFEYNNDMNYEKSSCMKNDMSYMGQDTQMYMGQEAEMMMCPPIHECPQERVCHRYICYEVPHE